MNYFVAILFVAVLALLAWRIQVCILKNVAAIEELKKPVVKQSAPKMPVLPNWTALDRRNLREFLAAGTGQKFIEASRHKIFVASIEATKDPFHTAHGCGMVAGADNLLLAQIGMSIDEQQISQSPQAYEGQIAADPVTNETESAERRSF